MQISRRDALMGAGAAAVVAGVPGAVLGEDAVLLARLGQFHDVYGEWQHVWAKQQAHRASVEAMSGCPQLGANLNHNKAHFAFLEAHDAYRYEDQSRRLGDQTGVLVKGIFETPAQTAKGALEKLKIAYTAIGDGGESDNGDIDLEAFQDWNAPWMEAVIRDLERLAGEARS